MEIYGLNHAISSFEQSNSRIINLWGWYALGNYAAVAALFSIGVNYQDLKYLYMFLAGFWMYAVGNHLLIKQELKTREALRKAIEESLKNEENKSNTIFIEAITKVSRIKQPIIGNVLAHFVVSASITFLSLMKYDVI